MQHAFWGIPILPAVTCLLVASGGMFPRGILHAKAPT